MKVKILRLCLLLALVLFIGGCARTQKTVPPFIANAPHEGGAIVYFYRPSKTAASTVTTEVRDNDRYVSELANGKFVEYVVNPGKHSFKMFAIDIGELKDSKIKLKMYISEPLVFEIKAGETHFIRMDYKAFTGIWVLTRKSPKRALEEIKYCNE